jgi:hypothetical protein
VVLTAELDNVLNNILINLADLYPQALPSGGTLRMRAAINEVNRVDDEENDFIYCSGIKIGHYLSEEGDYTQFVMKVINTIIEVTQDNKDDARERTIFEKFTQFNEHLFWAAQEKTFQDIIHSIEKSKD